MLIMESNFLIKTAINFPDEIESKIENLIETGMPEEVRPTGYNLGKAVRIDDAQGRYIQFLKILFRKNIYWTVLDWW
jgi:phosphoglucosamine mutase